MKHLSFVLEDRPGELCKAVGAIKKQEIDIKALYLGPGLENKGVVKMIVTDLCKAKDALDKIGIQAEDEPVVVVALDDQPGGLHGILELLCEAGLSIAHAYSFVSRLEGRALSVFACEDHEKAMQVLKEKKVCVVEHPLDVCSQTELDQADLASYVGGTFYF